MAFKTADLLIMCRDCFQPPGQGGGGPPGGPPGGQPGGQPGGGSEYGSEDAPDPSRGLVAIRAISRVPTTRWWKRIAVDPDVVPLYERLHATVEEVERQDPDLRGYGPYDDDPQSLRDLRQILQDALAEVEARIDGQSSA